MFTAVMSIIDNSRMIRKLACHVTLKNIVKVTFRVI